MTAFRDEHFPEKDGKLLTPEALADWHRLYSVSRTYRTHASALDAPTDLLILGTLQQIVSLLKKQAAPTDAECLDRHCDYLKYGFFDSDRELCRSGRLHTIRVLQIAGEGASHLLTRCPVIRLFRDNTARRLAEMFVDQGTLSQCDIPDDYDTFRLLLVSANRCLSRIQTVDDLSQLDGIGPATVEKIKAALKEDAAT